MFKWTGSKQRMLEQYSPLFFPKQEFDTFVDLFAGGLTNSLWVYEKFPTKKFIINDFNSELILLYSTLSSHKDEVISRWFTYVAKWLELSPDDRKKYYYELRDIYCLHHENEDDITISSMLLFMLQVNFNGMWKEYIKCNHRYSTPPGTCTQSHSFFDVRKIERVANFLSHAEILNVDFREYEAKKGDWLYADPPYRDSVVLYQGGFDESDQIGLAQYLTSSECLFAYSNKDIHDGFYDNNFPKCYIHKMSAKYTAGRGASVKDVSEVLVTNY